MRNTLQGIFFRSKEVASELQAYEQVNLALTFFCWSLLSARGNKFDKAARSFFPEVKPPGEQVALQAVSKQVDNPYLIEIVAGIFTKYRDYNGELFTDLLDREAIRLLEKIGIDQVHQYLRIWSEFSNSIALNPRQVPGLLLQVEEEIAKTFPADGIGNATPSALVNVLTSMTLEGVEKPRTMYDPFCRSGEFLQAAAYHMRYDELRRVVGSSGHHLELKFAKIRQILYGWPNAEVNLMPSFSPPKTEEMFDIILTNPPFGARVETDFTPYGKSKSSRSEAAFLKHIYQQLADRGKAGIIVPHSLLTSPQHRKLREELLADQVVEGVLTLPSHSFLHTNTLTALLILSRRGRQESVIVGDLTPFLGEQRGLADTSMQRIHAFMNAYRNLLNGEDEANELGRRYVVTEIMNLEANLLPQSLLSAVDYSTMPLETAEEFAAKSQKLIRQLRGVQQQLNELSGFDGIDGQLTLGL